MMTMATFLLDMGAGATVRADLFVPGGKRRTGAVIVLAERGANADEVRKHASRVACEGYVAMSLEPGCVENAAAGVRCIDAALDKVHKLPCSSGSVALVGFGEGSAAARCAAEALSELDGVVAFFGRVHDDAQWRNELAFLKRLLEEDEESAAA